MLFHGVTISHLDTICHCFWVPSGYAGIDRPVHIVGLAEMGLTMLDAGQFEDLAAVCERLQRWEFLYAMASLRFRNATGLPVTPHALF